MEDIIKQLQSLALTEALPYLLKLGGAFALWFVGRAVISAFQRVLSLALHKRKLDATLIRYVESLFSGILTILLLLGLLGLMGFETTSFAALLAAAGIAIGSAWAGLLGNFAAGIFLLVLRPFRVGDEINAGGVTGLVHEIGLFVTAVDTPDNLRIFVGNSRLFGDNIINYSHHPHRRLTIKVPVMHGSDVAAVRRALARADRRGHGRAGRARRLHRGGGVHAGRARARRPGLVPSPQRQRRAGRHGPRHPGGHRRRWVRRPPELALDCPQDGLRLLTARGARATPGAMSARLTLQVLRVRPHHPDPLPLPRYETAQAAGMDLRADIDGERTLGPLERLAVPTGLALALPPGYEGQVRPRSGLALKHGVTLLNSPGTIDADYRGEVHAILVNLSQEPFTLRRGDRVAQLVVAPVTAAELQEVSFLDTTSRGEGGFGSTGR